jgi:A/G-specific adenine glycosylase
MSDFSKRLIEWQAIHGRHDLPWQNTTDPYAIWVSEIMLQQTQVNAVIAYYAKFMARFPTIESLASAEQETVLQYWSGLGYYSRARNLHRAAQIVVEEFSGEFPQDFATVQTLPGIGRSTAAAIVSFAFDQIQTILDGNVKRVLARHFLIKGWPNSPVVATQMWALAESLLPSSQMVAYTQGLMDLGATICTRSKPKCEICPVKPSCQANAIQKTHLLPTPKPKKVIPHKETTMLIFRKGKEILLEKRPQTGIWAGLWSFPEISMTEIASEVAQEKFKLCVEAEEPLGIVQHVFTHFKLAITPQPLHLIGQHSTIPPGYLWLSIDEAIGAALPTPVRNILLSLNKT